MEVTIPELKQKLVVGDKIKAKNISGLHTVKHIFDDHVMIPYLDIYCYVPWEKIYGGEFYVGEKAVPFKVINKNNIAHKLNNKKLKIYLAGDMTNGWREKVISEFNKTNNRAEFIDPRVEEGNYAIGDYVKNDLRLVKESDIVFAYIAKNSPSQYIGTSCEITWAYAHNVPVVLVTEHINPHPFHLFCSRFIRTELDAGIKVLAGICENNDKVDYI